MPATFTDLRSGLTTSVAVKAPCKSVSTTVLSLTGAQTVGSISCVSGDRVLYAPTGGSTSAGIWVVSSTAWTRAKDFDGAHDAVTGTLVLVAPGTASATIYEVKTVGEIVIGTTNLEIGPFNLASASDVELAALEAEVTGLGVEIDAAVASIATLSTSVTAGAAATAVVAAKVDGTTVPTLKTPIITGTPQFTGSAIDWAAATTHDGNHTFSGVITTTGAQLTTPTIVGTPVFSGANVTWSGNPTHSGNHTFSGSVTFSGTVSVSPVPQPWTPALKFGGAAVGMTTVVEGYYIQIGKFVCFNCTVTVTAKGSSTGNATITGFPFTPNGTREVFALYTHHVTGGGSGTAPFALMLNGSGTINLVVYVDVFGGVTGNFTEASFGGDSIVSISGTLLVP